MTKYQGHNNTVVEHKIDTIEQDRQEAFHLLGTILGKYYSTYYRRIVEGKTYKAIGLEDGISTARARQKYAMAKDILVRAVGWCRALYDEEVDTITIDFAQ